MTDAGKNWRGACYALATSPRQQADTSGRPHSPPARSDGSEVLQPVDDPLDFIAATVDRRVEPCGAATSAATAPAVGPLVSRLRNPVLDLAPRR